MKLKEQNVREWIQNRIKPDEITKYLENGKDFIPDGEIEAKLKANRNPDPKQIKDILAKSLAVQTLMPDETAALLDVTDPNLFREMEETALAVKKKVYDNRIVTFAPLYIGNICVNNCVYCGFRSQNDGVKRGVLSLDQIRKETEVLAGKIGHKRLIVVFGEHPSTDIDYMVETIKTIYDVKMKVRNGTGNIRRVNVNSAPLSVGDLKRLTDVGIGTYQVFQETYHHDTYRRVHPGGTLKSNYQWRLYAMHRAMEAGIDDVGIGALFGLYDWKFEVMGLLYHAHELEQKCGIGPHTVSFPRLEPAVNTPFAERSPFQISDDELKRIITIVRLSIPYTGMIVTARENPDFRRDAVRLGITQMDASTQIGIGAYTENFGKQVENKQQFILGDTRSLEEVIRELAEMGYITSFCTAGYRCGRTGECIMDLLRTGMEGKFCKLNAVLTFREWLDDFAGEETRKIAEPVIQREMREVEEKLSRAYPSFKEYYDRISKGERDLYF